MCACEPGFTCTRCAGTPDDPRYLTEPDPAEQAARERYAALGEAWDAEPVKLVPRA